MRLFIYKICTGKSARVPAPPSKVGRACPARAEVEGEFLCFGVRKRRRKERDERDRDFKGHEQIFTGSKTKKYIYSVVLGLEGVRLEAEPAHGSVCYIDL